MPIMEKTDVTRSVICIALIWLLLNFCAMMGVGTPADNASDPPSDSLLHACYSGSRL